MVVGQWYPKPLTGRARVSASCIQTNIEWVAIGPRPSEQATTLFPQPRRHQSSSCCTLEGGAAALLMSKLSSQAIQHHARLRWHGRPLETAQGAGRRLRESMDDPNMLQQKRMGPKTNLQAQNPIVFRPLSRMLDVAAR